MDRQDDRRLHELGRRLPRLVAGLLLLAAASANAITPAGPAVEPLPGGGWRVLYPTSISGIPASTSGRVWEPIGAGMRVRDVTSIAARGGALPVTVARTTPWSVVGAAIARCLGTAAGALVCGAATVTGQYLYDKARLKTKGDGTTYWDDGDPPESTTTTEKRCYQSQSNQTGPCTQPWMQEQLSAIGMGHYAIYACTMTSSSYSCDAHYRQPNGIDRYTTITAQVSTVQVTTTQCRAVTDPFNPAYNVPAGLPADADGKCPSGRYNGIAPENASPKVFGGPGSTTHTDPPSEQWPGLADRYKDAVNSGTDPSTPPVTTEGPASQTGEPTTTTTTDPATGRTTTKTTTPTYTYNYSGDKITYSTTNTTVTQTCVDGSCNTVTETTTGTPAPTDVDLCKADPTIAACAKLGEAPPQDPIPRMDVPVSWSPVSFAAPAACPAPITWTFMGKVHAVGNFQPTCDVMVMLRAVLLAVGAATAAVIFMSGLRA